MSLPPLKKKKVHDFKIKNYNKNYIVGYGGFRPRVESDNIYGNSFGKTH